MKIKLRNDDDLARCKPKPGRQVDYWDATFPAFGLRVGATGAKSWVISYRKPGGGSPTRLSIGKPPGMDLDAARDVARRYLALAEMGADLKAVKGKLKQLRVEGDRRDGAAVLEDAAERAGDGAEALAFLDAELEGRQEEKALTFGTARNRFLKEYAAERLRPSSNKAVSRVLKSWDFADWENKPLADITRQDVRALLKMVCDRGAKVQANRHLAYLRKMLNWCVGQDLITTSPADKVTAPTREDGRSRVLTDGELAAIWRACEPGDTFGDIVRLLMLTGQRRMEVAAMPWTELDPDGDLWRLPPKRAKNSNGHIVHLAPAAVAIIKARPRLSDCELVFTASGGVFANWTAAKRKLDANANVHGWVLHDLRRTMVTWMAEHGIEPHVIERIVNHISGQTTASRGVAGTYNKALYLDARREALAWWAGHIAGLVGPGAGQQAPAPVQPEGLPANVIRLFG